LRPTWRLYLWINITLLKEFSAGTVKSLKRFRAKQIIENNPAFVVEN